MGISWVKSWAQTIEKAIGFPQLVDFMTYFPVYIYRDNFIHCREYTLKRFNTDKFEKAFKKFYHTGTGFISPVSVVISYAWYFEKDRYNWNLQICGDLNTYNNRLPEGHKIQPEHVKDVLTQQQTAYHGPF
jgi:Ca2+-binding EF-hand superfamily protein